MQTGAVQKLVKQYAELENTIYQLRQRQLVIEKKLKKLKHVSNIQFKGFIYSFLRLYLGRVSGRSRT